MTNKALLAEQLLAASIHEIKNRFGVVFSQLDTLLSDLTLDAQHLQQSEQIKSEAEYIGSELVRVLASYKALMSDDKKGLAEAAGVSGIRQDQVFLVDFLEEKIARHANTVRANHLQLQFDCDEELDGFFDPALVNIILDTAIYNAVKENAKTILLRAQREGDDLLLQIEDDGPGFPQTMLEPTGQVAGLKDDGQSTGLGLYFARTLIAQHEESGRTGQIELGKSAQLGGASVTLILPQ